MAFSINPYGYDPSMLAAVNAAYSPGLEAANPSSTPFPNLHKASVPPKQGCPLIDRLPYELRVHIVTYVLPCTIRSPTKDVIWLRGHTAILSTCRALYHEGMEVLYGRAVFLIDVHFDRVIFNYQWLIATDVTKANYGRNLGPEHSTAQCSHNLTPSQKIDFFSKFPPRVRRLMKTFITRLHFVDSYDGSIMFNTAAEAVLFAGVCKRYDRFVDESGIEERNAATEVLLLGPGPSVRKSLDKCNRRLDGKKELFPLIYGKL